MAVPEEHLKHLRELTETLPPVAYGSLTRSLGNGDRIKELFVEGGMCVLVGLYAESDMSVAMVAVTAGAQMIPHTHDQDEYFIMLSGEMVVHIGAGVTSVKAGEMFHVPANVNHWVEWPVATKVLTSTIPMSKDFPHD